MTAAVTVEKKVALQKRYEELGIDESDLYEKFTIGSGKGGQKLNKTKSAVYLKHLPSGISVKVSKTRFQNINRFLARRILADKYEVLISGKNINTLKEEEKKRKQKQRRKKRAKLKISIKD